MRRFALVVACLGAVGAVPGGAKEPGEGSLEPGPGRPLAWVRFADTGQTYASVPYVFVGDGEVRVAIEEAAGPGRVLDLLWGAKGDRRGARVRVNGKEVSVSAGGYDGFRWLRVPLPEGATGPRCEVTIRAGGGGKAAFLGEVRLTDAGAGGPAPDLKAVRHRAAVQALPVRGAAAQGGEAFPQMRPLWDREPAPRASADPREALYRQAERNGRFAAEGLYRCRRYVDGWLAHADPKSGLIPRNLGRDGDLWNGRDAAADNYPFLVLSCALTDRALFEGRMKDMLRTEIRLTSRVDRLGDNFLFSKQGWARERVDLDAIMFDNSEYVKDGLLPLTEWLGPSAWSERMTGLVEDIWKHAPVETKFSKIPTLNFEVNGDLLQACSRLYWFTGDEKYLDWAVRLGDYYLLGEQHPTRDLPSLRLLDHGCEVVNGLSELYLAVARARPEKKKQYEKPLHEIFQHILKAGRNADGLLYSEVRKDGTHSAGLCDTFGYVYDGFYTLYLVDKADGYRAAVRECLGNLKGKYEGRPWDDKSADGIADSVEGALNLYNREPVPAAAEWVDRQTRQMWAAQRPDGVIEGWHGDGNFARTTVMVCLWKSQGVTVQPWRADVRLGAVRDGDGVVLSVAAEKPWSGRLAFDPPRHKEYMRLPLDYPRINQFPEWFVVEAGKQYAVDFGGRATGHAGRSLRDGLPVELKAGEEVRLHVRPVR